MTKADTNRRWISTNDYRNNYDNVFTSVKVNQGSDGQQPSDNISIDQIVGSNSGETGDGNSIKEDRGSSIRSE